jgi:hypothetical protein
MLNQIVIDTKIKMSYNLSLFHSFIYVSCPQTLRRG